MVNGIWLLFFYDTIFICSKATFLYVLWFLINFYEAPVVGCFCMVLGRS